MDKDTIANFITSFSFWGGMIGFMLAVVPLVLFQIFSSFRVNLGDNLIGPILIFSIAILQIPIVFLGRMLKLPIESGGVAFIMCNLSPFGNLLLVVFWTVIGVLLGRVLDKIK